MKKMRRASLLSLVLVFSLMLSACASEAKLAGAFKKQQEITALEASTKLKFNLKATGLNEEVQLIVDEVAKVINEGEISVAQKSISNETKDVAEAKVYMKGKFADESMAMTAWVDVNLKDPKNPSMVQTIRLPKKLVEVLGEDFAGKEYLIYDFDELMKYQAGEEDENPVDMEAIMKWAVDAQPKITKFAENYGKKFNLDLDIVKSKGKKDVNGEKLDIFEITLNDKEFKELISYTGKSLLEDEDLKEIFEDYFTILIKAMNLPEEEKEEVKKGLEEAKLELPELKEEFKKAMDKIKDIQLLGEKGIKIELGINNKGYIVSEKGSIDLLFDLETLMKERVITITDEDGEDEEITIPGQKGKINFTIEYDTKIKNINNKEMVIDKPKSNKKNSFTMVQLMEKQKEEMEKLQKEFEEMEALEEAEKAE